MTITVNGLTMSTGMWTRVMAAVRGLYPELTGDAPGGTPLSDAGALQAVTLSVLTDWVTLYESQVGAPDPSEATTSATSTRACPAMSRAGWVPGRSTPARCPASA
jgi:hypothetical protein